MDMQSSSAVSSMGAMTMATSTGAMSSMMPAATATATMGSSMDMGMGGAGACKISVSCPPNSQSPSRLTKHLFPVPDVMELEHYRHL